jgi:hypothetical protein
MQGLEVDNCVTFLPLINISPIRLTPNPYDFNINYLPKGPIYLLDLIYDPITLKLLHKNMEEKQCRPQQYHTQYPHELMSTPAE